MMGRKHAILSFACRTRFFSSSLLVIDQERHTRTDTFIYAESNTTSAAVFYDLVAG